MLLMLVSATIGLAAVPIPISPRLPIAPYTPPKQDDLRYYAPIENNQAPLSLIVPTCREDFAYFPLSFASIANQTVPYHETIVIVSMGKAQDPSDSYDRLLIESRPFAEIQTQIRDALLKEVSKSCFVTRSRSTRPLGDSGYTPSYFFRRSIPVKRAVLDLTTLAPFMSNSMKSIPNLQFYIRTGARAFLPGNNRMFGASVSSPRTEICSFFDCDDYMISTRAQLLGEAFQFDPRLEVVWHRYKEVAISEWHRYNKNSNSLDIPPVEMPDFFSTDGNGTRHWLMTYEEWWENLPLGKIKCTEPFDDVLGCYHWYLARDYPRSFKYLHQLHNGWQTIKKTVLETIPYSDLASGEDSLYNWRTIRARRYVNFLPQMLGLYTRPY